jgi:predicted GNAT family acetyltransferase
VTILVDRHGTVDDFLGAAGAFLAEREAEHNLMFGICASISTLPELFADDQLLFLTVRNDTRVVGAALQTPPNNLVLSEMDFAMVDAVAAAVAGEALPGVLGPAEVAGRFADRWTANAAVTARLEVRERIFRLTHVVPPRHTSGHSRLAEPRDREVAAEWIVAFIDEANPGDPRPDDPVATVDRWIAGVYRQLYVWQDGGQPVCMVGAGGETPHGIRIGPVYTPPEWRRRGYASALTAAVSQDQLDRGRQFCFLFTDLANPTSNHIYRAIGYEPVRDVGLYRFRADA